MQEIAETENDYLSNLMTLNLVIIYSLCIFFYSTYLIISNHIGIFKATKDITRRKPKNCNGKFENLSTIYSK